MRDSIRNLKVGSSVLALVALAGSGCGTEDSTEPTAASPSALESALGAVRGDTATACDAACVAEAVDAYRGCIETTDRGEDLCIEYAVETFAACIGACAGGATDDSGRDDEAGPRDDSGRDDEAGPRDDSGRDDDSALGVYRGYFCNGELFIETLDIDRASALENCGLNAAANPEGVICTFDDEVLADRCGAAEPAPTAPGVCEGWEPMAFERGAERFSPSYGHTEIPGAGPFGEGGAAWVRFDERYGLWVGLVEVTGGYRFYLSDALEAPFLPAADFAGHGQDLCELVDPTFSLPHEDDITSGGCSACSTGPNVSLLGVEVYTRGVFGEPFTRRLASEWGADQTSAIRCAAGPAECARSGAID